MATLPSTRIILVMTVVAAITGPARVIAQSPDPHTTMATPTFAANSDRALLTTLTKADRDEVLMARAALPTLQDAEVKRFAQRMIDDHSAHLNATTTIATRLNFAPAPEITPGGETAPTTDASYVGAMVTGRKLARPQDAVRNAWRSVAVLMLAAVLAFWWTQWHSATPTGPANDTAAFAKEHDRDDD